MSSIPESRRPNYFDVGPFFMCAAVWKDEFKDEAGMNDKVLEGALKYSPRDDDLFVMSYPKCGSTWIQQIIYCLHNNAEPPGNYDKLCACCPFLEFNADKLADKKQWEKEKAVKLLSIRSHLPYDLAPKNPKSRYIVILRNPKDTCVSFYYHTKGIPFYRFQNGSFDDYFELFMEGLVDFGDYFKWLLSWLPHLQDDNVLLLTYESMVANPRECVMKLGTFIGIRDKLESNPQFVSDVIRGSSVEIMREMLQPYFKVVFNDNGIPNNDAQVSSSSKFDFVRKAVVNDWRTHMSIGQSERISNKFRRMAEEHPEVMSLWDDYSWL